jgi:hypothetical protein
MTLGSTMHASAFVACTAVTFASPGEGLGENLAGPELLPSPPPSLGERNACGSPANRQILRPSWGYRHAPRDLQGQGQGVLAPLAPGSRPLRRRRHRCGDLALSRCFEGSIHIAPWLWECTAMARDLSQYGCQCTTDATIAMGGGLPATCCGIMP